MSYYLLAECSSPIAWEDLARAMNASVQHGSEANPIELVPVPGAAGAPDGLALVIPQAACTPEHLPHMILPHLQRDLALLFENGMKVFDLSRGVEVTATTVSALEVSLRG